MLGLCHSWELKQNMWLVRITLPLPPTPFLTLSYLDAFHSLVKQKKNIGWKKAAFITF